MRFQSVLDLREELRHTVLDDIESWPTMHDGATPLRHLIGLGVSKKAKDDFALAVRTQSQSDDIRPIVDQIAKRAASEIDLRYVGVVRPESRVRPLVPGVWIGAPSSNGGTLGAFVRDRVTGVPMILTCAHVLSRTSASAGGVGVVQPSCLHGGDAERDLVANILRLNAPMGDDPWDAAVAPLIDGVAWHLDSADFRCGGDVAPNDVSLADAVVRKRGAATGATQGVVTAVKTELTVYYAGATVRFLDLIEVKAREGTAFSGPGDSGALVLHDDGRAVGLHTAGSRSYSYSQAIGPILDRLDVDLTVNANHGNV